MNGSTKGATPAHHGAGSHHSPAHDEEWSGLLLRLTAACPALLVALLVLKLWVTGTLRYYVNDRTVWIVLAGGLLFFLVGAVALVRRSERRPTWRTLLFAAPALLGLLVPAHPLSALSGQSSSLGALQLASHVSTGSAGDQFGTWIGELTSHPDPAWWAGRQVTLVGFASGQAGLPGHSFIVGRYLVTCCVVDATLLGFPVQLDRGRIPTDGAWVQVSGTFGTQYWIDPSGQHYPLIEHARISPVSIPSTPYLSP